MLLTSFFLISQGLAEPVVADHTSPEERYNRVTQIDADEFSDLALEGALVRPSGVLAVVVPRPAFHPLFQLRRDFAEEIRESPGFMRGLASS